MTECHGKNFDDKKICYSTTTTTTTTRWFDWVIVLTPEFCCWKFSVKDVKIIDIVRDAIVIYRIVRIQMLTAMYVSRVNIEIRIMWVAAVWIV